MSSLHIKFDDGYEIADSTDTMLFRGSKSKRLEEAFAILQPLTSEIRLNRIAQLLAAKRRIAVPSHPPVILYPDGTVEDEAGTRLSLKESRAKNALLLGSEYRAALGMSRESRPDEITILEEPKRFGVKKIEFEIYSDQDAWKSLLRWLADGNEL